MQSKIMYELFEMHIGAIFKVAFGDQSPKHIFAELLNVYSEVCFIFLFSHFFIF